MEKISPHIYILFTILAATISSLLVKWQINQINNSYEGAFNLFDFLNENNVLIRYFPQNPLTSSFVRISIGKQEEMDMLLDLISKWKIKDQQR